MEANEKQKALWREQKRIYRQKRKEYSLILTKHEANELNKFAQQKKMKVPAFVKSLIKAYGKNTGYILPDDNTLQTLVLEIRKIGTNINQTAKYVNTNKAISQGDIVAFRAQLQELEHLIISTLKHPVKKVR
jgi:molybdopterin converting factor small subunit